MAASVVLGSVRRTAQRVVLLRQQRYVAASAARDRARPMVSHVACVAFPNPVAKDAAKGLVARMA